MWTCQKCGEDIYETYDACWRCDTARGSNEPEQAPPARLQQAKASVTSEKQVRYPFVSSLLVVVSVVFIAYRLVVGIDLFLGDLRAAGVEQIIEGLFIGALGLAIAYIAQHIPDQRKRTG